MLLLQVALAFSGQQLLVSSAYAQDTAAPAAAEAPAAETAVPATDSAAAAAPAEDTANVAASAAKATEVVDNPYGLGALWAQGDFVAKGTLIILVIMSAFTWYIMVTKLWEQQRLISQAGAARRAWDAKSLGEGIQKLAKNSAYRAVAEDGLRAREHHDGKLTDNIALPEWVTSNVQRSVDGINSRMQGGLAFLATVGSTAPFVGLFGTVWGIYHALIAIGLAGQASIDKVAGPVGEALIMTAIGLAVAVPAVLGYNWLVRRSKVALEDLHAFAEDVQAYLVVGMRIAEEKKAGK
ncbi:Biopolymer transport exbB protein, putative [Ricinus communis]|uniref:Biopolymer transport protein ExbB n=1 Tax=Ricinus communis TaxID=3988 RepID=B9TC24_RICCO|nr:Biopolymer transport exbB protein, putative [Ricinus communis]